MIRAVLAFLQVQTAEPQIRFFNLTDPDPEPSIAWFILNAFLLVGAALGIMITFGFIFGGFRLWLLRRFPNNWFNGADKDDVSQTFRLTD